MSEHQATEVEKTDGFLLIFERPFLALAYALAYHRELDALGRESGVALAARIGIHLGEVALRQNQPEEVAKGAKPIELEGLAKPITARIASLAQGGQTLLTASAFEMAKWSAVDSADFDRMDWLFHGRYLFNAAGVPAIGAPVEKAVAVFEVGLPGFAPLTAPLDSEKAKRVDESSSLGSGLAADFDADDPIGSQIGPYRIERELGKGGMGVVYLANREDDELVMSVSIKLAQGSAVKGEILQRFRRERQLLADLNHPHIATLLDAGATGDGRPFFIMEYL